MARISGVDVSEFQADIDWPTVARTQSFAVLRATRSNYTRIDRRFHEYAAGATNSGIPFTAYHFAAPDHDPIEQADRYLATISGYPMSLPPVLDLETKPGGPTHARDNLNRKQRTDWAFAWMDRVEAETGRIPIVYCSGLYPEGFLDDSDPRWKRHAIWVAWYNRRTDPPAPKPWPKWHIWQWSDQNRVEGIQGNAQGATDQNWTTTESLAELIHGYRTVMPDPPIVPAQSEGATSGEVFTPYQIRKLEQRLGEAERAIAQAKVVTSGWDV